MQRPERVPFVETIGLTVEASHPDEAFYLLGNGMMTHNSSPEQINAREYVGSAADVWSV